MGNCAGRCGKKHFTNGTCIWDNNIHSAVEKWCDPNTREAALAEFGHISTWDVSRVTSMRVLFASQKTFNDDISRWDTSRVTNMFWMFSCAKAFNQPLGAWNVSSVTNMSGMFAYAHAFNQSLKEWDTTSVTDWSDMFDGADAFNTQNAPVEYLKTLRQNVVSLDRRLEEAKAELEKVEPGNGSAVVEML